MIVQRTEQAEPTRETSRYQLGVPFIIELRNGFFRRADRVEAFLADISAGGAAVVAEADPRFKVKKRYRAAINDHEGIIEIRNISEIEEGRVRLGVQFSRLGLELQELVDDEINEAKTAASRIAPRADR